jgi:hypothetical protein
MISKRKLRTGFPVLRMRRIYVSARDDAGCGSYFISDGRRRERRGIKTDHLVRFGYAELTANRDNLLCEKGSRFVFTSFHYWDSTENGTDVYRNKTAQEPFLAMRSRNEESFWRVIRTCILFESEICGKFSAMPVRHIAKTGSIHK